MPSRWLFRIGLQSACFCRSRSSRSSRGVPMALLLHAQTSDDVAVPEEAWSAASKPSEMPVYQPAAIVAAVLLGAATLACAQGVPLGTDASVGQAGIVTPGGGAASQWGRMTGTGSQAVGASTIQKGSASDLQSPTNSGERKRARVVSGDYGNDVAATAPEGSTLRGKPTKEQRTFNESRSNNTRTTSRPASPEAPPPAANSILK